MTTLAFQVQFIVVEITEHLLAQFLKEISKTGPMQSIFKLLSASTK